MRRRRNWIGMGVAAGLSAGLWLAGAGEARAATLPFSGEIALSIAALDPISIVGNGFATVVGRPNDADHLTGLGLHAGLFGTTGVIVPVTDPLAFPIAGVVATAQNATGTFDRTGAALGGLMPVLGVAKVCLFGACTQRPAANLSVPLSVVGNATGAAYVTGAVNVTVAGAPWTTGTVLVGTSTAMGFAHGPASGTTSTLAPSGMVRLVTPIFISTNIGASSVVPAFGFLTLHFVPEPATALLLGAGIAALIVGGRRSH